MKGIKTSDHSQLLEVVGKAFVSVEFYKYGFESELTKAMRIIAQIASNIIGNYSVTDHANNDTCPLFIRFLILSSVFNFEKAKRSVSPEEFLRLINEICGEHGYTIVKKEGS